MAGDGQVAQRFLQPAAKGLRIHGAIIEPYPARLPAKTGDGLQGAGVKLACRKAQAAKGGGERGASVLVVLQTEMSLRQEVQAKSGEKLWIVIQAGSAQGQVTGGDAPACHLQEARGNPGGSGGFRIPEQSDAAGAKG
jgi:hypothetical protein